MNKVTFEKDNAIPYFWDMRFFTGIPAGIPFSVEKDDLNKDCIKLRAPGYGSESYYGSGCIWVDVKDLPPSVKEEISL